MKSAIAAFAIMAVAKGTRSQSADRDRNRYSAYRGGGYSPYGGGYSPYGGYNPYNPYGSRGRQNRGQA